MRRLSIILALLPLTVALASPALAADPEKGKVLVERQCTGCHGSEVYGRQIKSLEALRGQVERCAAAAETSWSPAQKADVVAYLNKEFYRFE